MAMQLLKKIKSFFFLSYPFLVFVLVKANLNYLALSVAGFSILLHLDWQRKKVLVVQVLSLVFLVALISTIEAGSFVRLFPFVISMSFFWMFLNAYLKEENIIERYVKVFKNDISQAESQYFRAMLPFWIAFLGLNSFILFILIFFFPLSVWLFYSGFLFYVILFLLVVFSIFFGRMRLSNKSF